MSEGDVRSCDECGASIYPEHLGAQKAGFWGGRLVCVHCYSKHQSEQVTISPNEVALPGSVIEPPGPRGAQPDEPPPAVEVQSAGIPGILPLAEAPAISIDSIAKPSSIRPFGGPSEAAGGFSPQRYKRHLHHDGRGAIRCRILHAKLNDGALRFVEDQINNWIDQNPEIEIKHVTTDVGVVEGKSSEPHLIITLFY